MDSLKKLILNWLGIYDILLEVDRLKKDLAHYKAKLEYFASASAGIADVIKEEFKYSGFKVDSHKTMLEYLGGCMKKKEL